MDVAPPDDDPPRRRLAAEVALVVGVVVVPNVVHGLCDLVTAPVYAAEPFATYHARSAALSLSWIALAAFVTATSREPAASFGVRPFRPVRDVLAGVVVLAVLYPLACVTSDLLDGAGAFDLDRSLDHSLPPAARTTGQFAVVVVAYLLVGVSEELVYRGVLLTRLAHLTKSVGWGLFASSVLFGLCHVYYGPGGALECGLAGLAFGAAFLWFGRVWPVALAHGAYDILLTLPS